METNCKSTALCLKFACSIQKVEPSPGVGDRVVPQTSLVISKCIGPAEAETTTSQGGLVSSKHARRLVRLRIHVWLTIQVRRQTRLRLRLMVPIHCG